jgi:hypothetical protein
LKKRIDFLLIVPAMFYSAALTPYGDQLLPHCTCKDSENRAKCKINCDLFSFLTPKSKECGVAIRGASIAKMSARRYTATPLH